MPLEPSVTIVVPAYNRAELLPETLDSVLGQDYPGLELLVLDDGSTDETPELLARYAGQHHDRFRWDRHDNMGQARTLNRGFELARGEVLGHLSSDDLLLPGAISRLVEELRNNPGAAVAYPGYHVIDAAGETVDTITPPPYSRVESVRLGDTIVGPGALFRRTALAQAGGWDAAYRYLGDFDFWLRLSAAGAFRCVPEPLACWRRHEGALTVADRGLEMAHERLRLLEAVFARDPTGELEPVREQAYRNAFILGAVVVGPGGLNAAGERYYVSDTHARAVSETSGAADPEAKVAEMRERVAAQRQTIEELREQNAQLKAVLGRRRPLLRGVAKLTPRSLRPFARQFFGRAAGGSTSSTP